MKPTFKKTLIIIIIITLSIQIVHFGEHILQAGVWIFEYKDRLYMSPLGMWGMESLGKLAYPNSEESRQMHVGFELLHLVGNGIFLIGILSFYVFRKTKDMLWALIVESFHFYEHVSLTASAIFIHKSIGLSTFFGLVVDPSLLLAYRVWWHFFFNMIPSILVAYAVWKLYKNRIQKQIN